MIRQPINTVKDFFVAGFGALNHLLWPKRCTNCSCVIFQAGSDLCNYCGQELNSLTGGDYCSRCGRNVSEYAILNNSCPICLPEEFMFDAIARAGVYDGPLREMILSFKRDSDKAKQTSVIVGKFCAGRQRFFQQFGLFCSCSSALDE